LKILSYTTLYPNAADPSFGVFVENRLRHLVSAGGVDLRVVAPVPWFPFRSKRFGRYGVLAGAPSAETRHGISIVHPRYPTIPRIGMTAAPALLAMATIGIVRRMIRGGFDFDLIDAHYFYPDGVAAAIIGRRLGKPVVITGRGTDLNDIPRYALPRKMIRWAADEAAASITVCQALKDSLVALGIAPDRVHVLRNGVDLKQFRPMDRAVLRREFGIDGPALASVGYLIPRKGHEIVIGALPLLPGTTLLIAGDGPEEAHLKSLAARLGVADRVRFLGRLPHDGLARLYGAVDALVLASSREGWANVLLEAMACGTPVVASNVWGTPEVVAVPEAGVLMRARTPEALAEAVRGLLASPPDRAATRAYAEQFSWDATTQGQLQLFTKIIDARAGN